VWRCNDCAVVMHNVSLNLRYDRRQATRSWLTDWMDL
jgi:hypothetical protein